MRDSDLGQVLAIERSLYTDPWSEMMFKDEIQKHYAFVAVDQKINLISGFICFWVILDELHLTNIAVNKSQQNKSIGSMLFDYMLEYMKKKSVRVCVLEVRKSNEKAIGFYKKKGFIKVGCRVNYYSNPPEDADVMVLILDEGKTSENL